MASHRTTHPSEAPRPAGRDASPGEPGPHAGEPGPHAGEPDGSDFAPDPTPVRSDQLPEDAPEPVAPD